MIVATAGHVDHGKTTLVKALTQVDTDTLAEERRRGMTIDLGFAYADFGEGVPIGFVDVPGHERFIRNMLAGVACIDLALLVIAADDGPMPQSREHLSILALLGVPRLVVVLTKVDRVSPERRVAAEREIALLLQPDPLAPGPFAEAPVFAVVATSGEGVPALRQHLIDVGRSLPARAAEGHFRLAVDRSFLLTGAGRIVAGAVLSGSVHVGDRVVVSPHGASARVRGIHAQNRRADLAVVGQRCALNLVGSELRDAEPARGDWIVAPRAHAPSARLDVQLEVPADEPRPFVDRGGLLLHIGAAAVPVRVVVLIGAFIAPGGRGFAQLVLDVPVAALHGDRFILRHPAAARPLAGGLVLDPFAPARGRFGPERADFLAAAALPAPGDALARLLADAAGGIELGRFALARNLTDAQADRLYRALAVEIVEDGAGGRWGLSARHWQKLRERVRLGLEEWHATQPATVGPSVAALAERLGLRRGEDRAGAALDSLAADGVAVRAGLRWRLSGHRAELSPADREQLSRVTALLVPAGLRPPIVGELAERLALPLPELLDFLARTSGCGALVRVAPNRFFLPSTVAELAAQAGQLAAESTDGRFDAGAYRDRTGIGRNLTVQVLEYLDREGVTRFDGHRRSAGGHPRTSDLPAAPGGAVTSRD